MPASVIYIGLSAESAEKIGFLM